MIRSPLRRKTSLRDSYAKKLKADPARARKPAFKKGPKTKEWDADRAKLKKVFVRAGITRCELEYSKCQGDSFLGFCHSKKRRNVVTKDDREEVVLGCQNCHDVIEVLDHTSMEIVVRSAIDSRETPVESIFD